MSNLTPCSAILLTTALFAGCTAVGQPVGDHAEGWRRARIVAIVDGQTPVRPTHGDCRLANGGAKTSAYPHVLASYAFGGNPNLRHTMVVPVTPAMPVSVGQSIRINVAHCAPALPLAPDTP